MRSHRIFWGAVLAALVSALLTTVATAQTVDDLGGDRADQLGQAFEAFTPFVTTTIVDPDRYATLRIEVRAQGNGLADLPLVDSVYIGYRCAGGPTTLLYVWLNDFGLVDFTLGTGDDDAYVFLQATRFVEPGVCGAWVARGPDPGAFSSGGGLFNAVGGETTVVHFTGRSGSGFNCRGRPATIVGTQGDDVLMGTSGDDVIVADLGDDVVRGRGGDDVICGGAGDDQLWGNTGSDRLYGGGDSDIVRGGRGTDLVVGGGGFDIGDGGFGDDRCNAEFVRRCAAG